MFRLVFIFLITYSLEAIPRGANDEKSPDATMTQSNYESELDEDNCLSFDDDNRPYSIVGIAKGGWPSSLVSGPFNDVEEDILCHSDMNRCESGEGVDAWFSDQYAWCGLKHSINSTHIRLSCGDENNEEEQTLPIECCERFPDGDAAVFETQRGYLHYVTYREDPRTMVLAMNKVEERHLEQLRASQSDKPKLISYFVNDQYDGVVPLRIRESPQYPDPYRILLKSDAEVIDEKWSLAKLTEEHGLNVKEGPFPVTYFSCEHALDGTAHDPSAKFFIKPVNEVLGRGIQVKYRSELAELQENDECHFGREEEVVLQEAITDLALISGSRFDGRVYMLVHNGKAYMHNNCLLSFTPNTEYNASCAEQAFNFSQKHMQDNDTLVYAFYNNTSKGKPHQWLEATYEKLVAALPVLEPVTSAAKDDKIFHIFALDVMIRENGEAIFTEINAWPNTDWMGGERDVAILDENGQEAGERIAGKDGAVAHYEHSMTEMFADMFSIVLGLADVDEQNKCGAFLGGRVREIVASGSRCTQYDLKST